MPNMQKLRLAKAVQRRRLLLESSTEEAVEVTIPSDSLEAISDFSTLTTENVDTSTTNQIVIPGEYFVDAEYLISGTYGGSPRIDAPDSIPYIKRFRVYYNGASGTKKVYFKNTVGPSGTPASKNEAWNQNNAFYSDVQFFAADHRRANGEMVTSYRVDDNLSDGNPLSSSWETTTIFTSGSMDTLDPTWSWNSIVSANINGTWKRGTVPSGSSTTGRLNNPLLPSQTSAGLHFFAESSSPVTYEDSIWMRTEELSVQNGDFFDVLLGTDAQAVGSFTIFFGD